MAMMPAATAPGKRTRAADDDAQCVDFVNVGWVASTLSLLWCCCSMADCLDVAQLPRWSRTYAKAVAGWVSSFSFDDVTRIAVLNFTADTSIQAPTVIFFSRAFVYALAPAILCTSCLTPPCRYDGHDVSVHTQPEGLLQHDIQGDHVILSPTAGAPKTFDATVTLMPLAGDFT